MWLWQDIQCCPAPPSVPPRALEPGRAPPPPGEGLGAGIPSLSPPQKKPQSVGICVRQKGRQKAGLEKGNRRKELRQANCPSLRPQRKGADTRRLPRETRPTKKRTAAAQPFLQLWNPAPHTSNGRTGDL
nr:unnamed protein product [Homo sapiens]